MTSRTVDLGGPLHYVDHGGEGDPVVLVHGLGGSHVNWCGVGTKLAERHRVYAIDLPGFGKTRLHGRSADVESNAKVLGRFVEEVAQEPATLVGNSMGGALSAMAAAAAPETIRATVLVNAALPRGRGAKVDREVALLFATYMTPWVGERTLARWSAEVTPADFVRRTLALCAAEPKKIDPAFVDAHVALAEERRAGGPSAAWAKESDTAFLTAARSLMRALIAARVTRALDAVRSPVLLVHGDKDRLVHIASARAVSQRRGWALEILEGIGHLPQLEAPDRFVEVVETWLASSASAASGVSRASATPTTQA